MAVKKLVQQMPTARARTRARTSAMAQLPSYGLSQSRRQSSSMPAWVNHHSLHPSAEQNRERSVHHFQIRYFELAAGKTRCFSASNAETKCHTANPRKQRQQLMQEHQQNIIQKWNDIYEKQFIPSCQAYQQVFLQSQFSDSTELGKNVLDWNHPPSVDCTWEMLEKSKEAAFFCFQSCSEQFEGWASEVPTNTPAPSFALDPTTEKADSKDSISIFVKLPQRPVLPPPTASAVDLDEENVDFDSFVLERIEDILDAWYRWSQQRRALEEALRPRTRRPKATSPVPHSNKENYLHYSCRQSAPEPTSEKDENTSKTWLGRIWNFTKPATNTEEDTATPRTMATDSDSQDLKPPSSLNMTSVLPTRHHINVLLGRIYYRFPNMTSEEGDTSEAWYTHRVERMQSVCNRLLSHPSMKTRSQSQDSPIAKKSWKLLVRAYTEVGTFEACRDAEQIYQQHKWAPSIQRDLFQHVIVGYWWLVQKHCKRTRPRPSGYDDDETAWRATQRVVELVLGSDLSRNRHLAIECASSCLLHTSCAKREAEYFQLANALITRCFGKSASRILLATDTKSQGIAKGLRNDLDNLMTKSSSRLSLWINLIQAYGQAAAPKAQQQVARRWMKGILECYPHAELQNAIDREVFHALLEHSNCEDLSNEELFKRMLSATNENSWWPNAETWRCVSRAASRGNVDAECVWKLYELAFMIREGRRELTWAEAFEHALPALVSSAKMRDNKKSLDRAWRTFQSLVTASSRPYFFYDQPHLVQHLYSPSEAPSGETYYQMMQLCGLDWKRAQQLYRMAQKQQDERLHYDQPYVAAPAAGARTVLTLSTEFESLFLHLWSQQRDGDTDEQAKRDAHAQQVYQMALENDETLNQELLVVLKDHFPAIYQDHTRRIEAQNSLNQSSSN